MYKRNRWIGGWGGFLLALCSATTAPASQQETTGIGARAISLGGAVAASVDDPSAVYYNPAGLVHLSEATLLLDLTTFSLVGDSNNQRTGETFDFSLDAFVIRPTPILGGPLPWRGWHWGIGILGVSGLSARFPDDSGDNRYASWSGKLLQTTLTPSLAYQVNPNLAVGVTVEWSMFTKFSNRARLGDGFVGDLLSAQTGMAIDTRDGLDDGALRVENDHNFPGLRPHNTLAADFRSASYIVGLTYRLDQYIPFVKHVGLVYREESEATMRGHATFRVNEDITTQTGLTTQRLEFESDVITRPRMVNVGVTLEPFPRWLVHGEVQWSNWNALRSFDFRFGGNGLFGQRKLVIPADWHNTWSARVGIERIFASGKRLWLGYWLDKDPIPDRTYFSSFITGDGHYFSLGFLLPQAFGQNLDLAAYTQIGFFDSRLLNVGESINQGGLRNLTVNAGGELRFGPNDEPIKYHNAAAYIVGITLTYRFGGLFGGEH